MSVYLNNAATSFPKPDVVLEAMANAASLPPVEPGRSGRGDSSTAQCRRGIASLLGIEPTAVALLPSATHALNIAIRSLAQRHVVLTAIEHNSALRPVAHSPARATVVPCGASGRVRVDDVANALEPSTELVIVSHVSNVTGVVQPIEAIARVAEAHGAALLVDAAQSAGIVPIPKLPGRVMYALAGHKGLYGPAGTGALAGAIHELSPLIVGGTGTQSERERHPSELPLRHEAGTPNAVGNAGWAAGIRWVNERGIRELGERRCSLSRRLRVGLGALSRSVRLVPENVDAEDLAAGVVSLIPTRVTVAEASYALEEAFGITTRAGLHCSPRIHRELGSAPEGTLRISFGAFNTEEDVDAALTGLEAVCA